MVKEKKFIALFLMIGFCAISYSVYDLSSNEKYSYWKVIENVHLCKEVSCKKMKKSALRKGVIFRVALVNKDSYLIEVIRNKQQFYIPRRDYEGQLERIAGHWASLWINQKGLEGGSKSLLLYWKWFLLALLLLPGLNYGKIFNFYSGIFMGLFRIFYDAGIEMTMGRTKSQSLGEMGELNPVVAMYKRQAWRGSSSPNTTAKAIEIETESGDDVDFEITDPSVSQEVELQSLRKTNKRAV